MWYKKKNATYDYKNVLSMQQAKVNKYLCKTCVKYN